MTEINVKIIGSGTVAQKAARVGSAIQLHAIPNSGAVFIRWEGIGGLSSSAFSVCNVNPRYVTTVVAVFSEEISNELDSKESTLALQLQFEESAVHDKASRLWVDDSSIQVIKKFDAYGRFIVNDDGTVLDQSTSLMWTYKIYPGKISMNKAILMEKHFAGHVDWRIPRFSELKSIFPDGRHYLSTSLTGLYWNAEQLDHKINSTLTAMGVYMDINADPVKQFGLLRLVRSVEKHSFKIHVIGNGVGSVESSLLIEKLDGSTGRVPRLSTAYSDGTRMEFVAVPDRGSRFVQWSGDASGSIPSFTIGINGAMEVTAEFEQITYPLHLRVQGSGEGQITQNPQEKRHFHGSIVTLCATADKGSKFKQWVGDVGGTTSEVTIKMDGSKTVTAEFVRVYSLTVSTQGKGLVNRSVIANEYEADSTVTLTAAPEEGHEFVQWHGAATGAKPVCKLTMNQATAVKAEFRPLPTFILKAMPTGTGRGVVWPAEQTFLKGSVVEIEAKAADGCVFDGWGGDVGEGLEPLRKVTVNSNLAITATFNRVDVPHTDIALAFDEVSLFDQKNDEATGFYFTLHNQSDRQIRFEMPMAGFVTAKGEEIEQLGWAKGMIDGEKGATLRAGTFRKMGLLFDSSRLEEAALGEHLHIALLVNKPAQRLTFSYRCTDEDDQVMALVHVNVEPLAEAETGHSTSATSTTQTELAARMQLLEKSLQEALSRLNAPATPASAAATTQTLPEILAWLCTQNSVPVTVLRQKLLPLGLMPSAVMDDVNERAFDVAGELALEEAADTVAVQRGVLLQVLAVWQ